MLKKVWETMHCSSQRYFHFYSDFCLQISLVKRIIFDSFFSRVEVILSQLFEIKLNPMELMTFMDLLLLHP